MTLIEWIYLYWGYSNADFNIDKFHIILKGFFYCLAFLVIALLYNLPLLFAAGVYLLFNKKTVIAGLLSLTTCLLFLLIVKFKIGDSL